MEFVASNELAANAVPIVAFAMFAALAVLLITIVPGFANADSVKELISAADSEGFANKPVLMFHTVSHNAEFYAEGRIQRDEKGVQKKILSLDGLVDTLVGSGDSAVVLMPAPYLEQIKTEKRLEYRLIGENDEVTAAGVWVKAN